MTGYQPVILENYLTSEEVDLMLHVLDKIQKPSTIPNMSGSLGYRTSVEADSMSMSNPVVPLTGEPLEDKSILKTTEVILKVKKDMEDFFKIGLSMINCNYTIMHPGSSNPLHADTTELDGVLIPESKELEYSALIYLNNHGADYTGGTLFFPLQDLNLETQKGTVVFFKGDYSRPHGVTTIESGDRKLIVLFFTREGNVSDIPLFRHPGAGVPDEELSEEEIASYKKFYEENL
jgi:hypothetical protein